MGLTSFDVSTLITYSASRAGLHVSWTTQIDANAFTSKVNSALASAYETVSGAMTPRSLAPAVA